MRALFVGLGGVGQRHLRNLRALAGDAVDVIAWRRRRADFVLDNRLQIESDAGLEEKYGVRPVDTLEQGLAARPDVVFVCGPTIEHVEVSLAAARAGCHLFIEKPIGASLDGVEDLVAEVERRGLVSFVGYQLRFHPLLQRAKALLDEGAAGPLVAARFSMGDHLPSWHPYEDYRQMYAAREALGGGVILSQIHDLDLVCWLLGMPRRVFAMAGHWTPLEIDVEDTASMLFECEADGHPVPVHVHQDYIQRPGSRGLELIGRDGRIGVDLPAAELRLTRVDHPVDVQRLEGFDRNDMFLAELRHFLECVRSGRESDIPVRAGAQSLRLALAARESARTGSAIAVHHASTV